MAYAEKQLGPLLGFRMEMWDVSVAQRKGMGHVSEL